MADRGNSGLNRPAQPPPPNSRPTGLINYAPQQQPTAQQAPQQFVHQHQPSPPQPQPTQPLQLQQQAQHLPPIRFQQTPAVVVTQSQYQVSACCPQSNCGQRSILTPINNVRQSSKSPGWVSGSWFQVIMVVFIFVSLWTRLPVCVSFFYYMLVNTINVYMIYTYMKR